MSLTFLLVLGLIGIWLIARGNAGVKAAEVQRAIEDPDGTTLDELARAGSNLTREHLIEFYLYFPERDAAEAAEAVLQAEGFETRIHLNEKEGDWTLLATRRMRPELAPLRAMRDRLTALVDERGGVYDGWGTEVENDHGRE
ncbi:MAG TPA: ribonuclease E inhibitor RraB [Gemmatimonadales bacterium]|nr:ribonuclease E inhibitor RraB [Gemmatimonadales bacterium]